MKKINSTGLFAGAKWILNGSEESVGKFEYYIFKIEIPNLGFIQNSG